MDISVDFAGLRLKNPVFTASGTCGYGDELADFMDVNALGGFITKSITLKPRKGNRTPRIVETDAGMLNAIGLANVGLDRFLAEKLPTIAQDDRAGVRERRRGADRGIRRGRRAAGPRGGDRRVRAEHQLPERGQGRHQLRPRPVPGQRDHGRRPQGRGQEDADREALAQRDGHQRHRPGGGRGGRGRPEPHQHLHRDGDRHRDPQARPGQPHGRALRSGDQADCRLSREQGLQRGDKESGHPDPRPGRHPHGFRRHRVPHRRRVGGRGRHRQLHPAGYARSGSSTASGTTVPGTT